MPIKAARKFDWNSQTGRKGVRGRVADDSDHKSSESSSSEELSGDEDEEPESSEPENSSDEQESLRRQLSPLEIRSNMHPQPANSVSGNVLSVNDSPSEELFQALERLSLSSVRMHHTHSLPFLLRNLRKGFEARCQMIGVPVPAHPDPRDSDVSVDVVYRYIRNTGGREHEYRTHVTEWSCPLCTLHGKFGTRDMLEKHLDWDHDEVTVKWSKVQATLFQSRNLFIVLC